jgi:plasmid stabilization system protein ParE
LIEFTPRARGQFRKLVRHYEDLNRPEATYGLVLAVEAAWRSFVENPSAALSAPRPYPNLARSGRAWIKAGRYWVSFSTLGRPVIVAVFFDTADIPGRV